MRLLCAGVLAALLAAPARAAGPSPTARVDASLASFKASLDLVQQCFSTEDSLRADLAHKKAQYAAEYKGSIPPDFQDLLGQKSARISRVHESCARQYAELNKAFDDARYSFAGINQKVVNVKKQQAILQQLTARYRALDRKGKAGRGQAGAGGTQQNGSSDGGSEE